MPSPPDASPTGPPPRVEPIGAPTPSTLALGRYQLGPLLGEGAMAAVYEAYDVRLKRWRAVKILDGQIAKSAAMCARFELEASALASIDHPGIIRIFDVGSEDGRPYLVMELADGGSADDWLERHGRMPARVAVDVVVQVARGLEVVHRAGIVHRDVKPANILFTGGNVAKLADFGIALAAEGQGRHKTRTGVGMGTVGFMAPEQRADAHAVGPVADVYALASTLFALVTGRFSVDLFAHSLHPGSFDGVPESLAPVIKRAVAYLAAERTASAAVFADELEAITGLPEPPADVAPLVARDRPNREFPIRRSDPTWGEQVLPAPGTASLPTMVPDGAEAKRTPEVGTTSRGRRIARAWTAAVAGLLAAGLVIGGYALVTHQSQHPQPAISVPSALPVAPEIVAPDSVASAPETSPLPRVVPPVTAPASKPEAGLTATPVPTGRSPVPVMPRRPTASVEAPRSLPEAVVAIDLPAPDPIIVPSPLDFDIRLNDLRAGPAGSSLVVSFTTSKSVRPVHYLVEGGGDGSAQYRVRLSGVSSRSLGLSDLSVSSTVANGLSVKESSRGTEISIQLTSSQIAPVKLDVAGNHYTLTISPKAP